MEFKRRHAFASKAARPLAGGTPAPRRRRRWRRLVWRTSVRLIVWGGLAILAALVFICVHPWSNQFIDQRLQQQWRRQTGLVLQYDRATFLINDGLVQIDRPALIDPDSGRTLLEAGRLSLRSSPVYFLFDRSRLMITSVNLEGPFSLELMLRDGRLTLTAPWDRLLELLDRESPDAPAPSAVPSLSLGHVSIAPVNLTLSEDRAGEPQALLRLTDATVDANLSDVLTPRQMQVRGRLNGREGEESLRLNLNPGGAPGSFDFNLALRDLDSRRDLTWPSPVDWRARNLEVTGKLEHKAIDDWTVSAKTSAEQIVVLRPDPLPPRQLGDASLEWSLRVGLASRRIQLQNLDLKSSLCRLKARGAIEARYPFPYDLSVSPIEFSGLGLELLAGHWSLLSGLRLQPEAAFALTGETAGDFSRLLPRKLGGRVNLHGVDWVSPLWPTPLNGLRLEAQLTTDTLTIGRLQGIVGGIPVELTGRLRGPLLDGHVRRVDLDWTTLGSVTGLMNLLEQKPTPGTVLPKLSGNFTGQGNLRVLEPSPDLGPDWLSRVRLNGRIMFQDGSVQHPALPAPLQKLNGQVDLALGRIDCRRLTGECLGAHFTLDGGLEGLGGFWIEPHADLRVSAGGSLDRLIPPLLNRFPAARAALDALTSPTGRLDLNLSLHADLHSLADARYSGALRLEDAATTLSLPMVTGPIRIDKASLTFTSDTLKIAGLQGALRSVAIQADADLTPRSGRMKARLEGPLADIKTSLPQLMKRFTVGGQATVRHEGSFALRPSSPPFERWNDWLPLARAGLARPDDLLTTLSRLVDLHYGGQVQVHNLEWTFITMPTPLRGINGPLRYDERHFWNTEPLTVEGGIGGRGLTSDFEIVFPSATQTPILRFDAQGEHFPLDAWASHWKPYPFRSTTLRTDYPKDYQTNTSEPLTMIIEGRVRSKSVTFYRIKGSDFDGNFHLDIWPIQPNILRWDNVKASIYGGRLETSGRFFNDQMTNEISLDQVNLAELAKALAGREHAHGIFSGILSGAASLHTGYDRFDSPPAGKGQLQIAGSHFVSNALLGRLGGLLNLPIFNDISFANIRGPFTIQYPTYSTTGINLENPLMNLELSGNVDGANRLDMALRVQFLHVAGELPLIGEVVGIFNRLAGSLIRFRVQGTVENPRLTPL